MVTDWELHQIARELSAGDPPDVVAYRHGVPRFAVIDYDIEVVNPWTEAEDAFVRDNYPRHGRDWDGWELIGKSYEAVERHAVRRGIRKRYMRWTEEEDELIRRYYPSHGASWDGWPTLMWWREHVSKKLQSRASAIGVRYMTGDEAQMTKGRKE